MAAKATGKVRTVCYVEKDAYAQGVLMSRIRDGGLDEAPIWDDVVTFRGRIWRGHVDIVSGGFPCQDLSIAGKQVGIESGARSGLWKEFARIIREVGPRFVLVENVPGILIRGQLGLVLGELAAMGFDAQWQVLSAGLVGAPHLRERVWILAYPKHAGMAVGWRAFNVVKESQEFQGVRSSVEQSCSKQKEEVVGNNNGQRKLQSKRHKQNFRRWSCDSTWWESEPAVGRVVYGVDHGVDRIRCLGNGVVPQQAKPVWDKIIQMSENSKG